jgi:hypothetical protein
MEEFSMKPRSILNDFFGVSILYDAVLFLVMVSLAGVILLPALRSPLAVESSVEKHREEIVDEALHTFLVSRADQFEYVFCGEQVNVIAEAIGINTSEPGLYQILIHWLLAHEQRHKTYANLLAEDLGCQFKVPVSIVGTNRLNPLTTAFHQQLRNETQRFFSSILSDKYQYNLTAWWHPITSISFGGEFSVGASPPPKDTYVAHSIITMPYAPVFCIGNQTFIFTKYSLTHELFSGDVVFGRSSIPAISNITVILENYTNGHHPYDTRYNATAGIQENLSSLLYGFLIYGITNETNARVFPGILNMTLTYEFEKIKNITRQLSTAALNETFGDVIQTIDTLFSGLNTSVDTPLSSLLLDRLNEAFGFFVNTSGGSLNETFTACEALIIEQVTGFLKNFLDPIIESFVDTMFNGLDLVKNFADHLIDWLFDRISLVTAEVTLTLWVVRE